MVWGCWWVLRGQRKEGMGCRKHTDCSGAARWWLCRQSRAFPVTCSPGAPAMRPPTWPGMAELPARCCEKQAVAFFGGSCPGGRCSHRNCLLLCTALPRWHCQEPARRGEKQEMMWGGTASLPVPSFCKALSGITTPYLV